MISSFISTLNKKQLEAVQQPLQPTLVLAGPGTGKTRLLIGRIGWLIEKQSIPPSKILALTFTNKAAGELKSRLSNIVGEAGNEVNAGTFHAFALQLIKKYHNRLGLNKYFSVCDQQYQENLIKNLSARYTRENLENKVRGILLSFSNFRMKNKNMPVFAQERFNEYLDHLKKHNLVDFDQIVLFCRDLLNDNPDILEQYQYLYPCILIDEFQDTDPIQYEIIKLLAQKDKNIFIVADDDQSIYSWRGANPENIRMFIEDFQIKTPIFLEINYRSGDKILDSARNIILNTDRIEPDKKLRVNDKSENHVELRLFLTEKEEVDFIFSKILEWTNAGVPYNEIALIYPFHKIGKLLEQFFINDQISYQMAGGKSLLDNPVINKMILYLRLVRDVNDFIALEALTTQELGQTLVNFIKQEALKNSQSFRQTLYKLYRYEDKRLNLDANLRIKKYIEHIANLVNLKNFYNLGQFINEIYSATEHQRSSFLKRNIRTLQPVSVISDILNKYRFSPDQKKIYVYHSDARIAFLASELIFNVLNKKSVFINNIDQYSAEKNTVLIELETKNNNLDKLKCIPVWQLENEKRKGALSNLFKYLQWITSAASDKQFNNFIVLDLETTGKNTDTCGIVEFAAVSVSNFKINKEIYSLINPGVPISRGAQDVHHIAEEDVKDAPTIEQFWPKIKEFIGDKIIIAHNGHRFDFAILDRFSRKIDGKKLVNNRFDTLGLARNIFPDQPNSIDALIDRFKLKYKERHRAQDDVRVLVEIFKKLQELRIEISRRSSLEMFTDIVALGNFIQNRVLATEDRLFFVAGARKLVTAYSLIRSAFAKNFKQDEIMLQNKIRERLDQLQPYSDNYNKEEHLVEKIKELTKKYDHLPIDEAIAGFLDFTALNNTQDQLENINAVSLLTYHAAKGLEFDKVILIGMENKNMPGFHALQEDANDERPVLQKLEEQRRLFYVGLTRAKSEVILTSVKNRGGWEHESSPFLKDLHIPRIVSDQNKK